MKPAYTNAVTPTVTDWRGISHARMTAAMEDLSPVAYKALGMMRRRWREHESRILTVREAGDLFGCSPSTAGRILKELEEYGFILRSACGLSYVITLLSPVEMENRSKFDRPQMASQSQQHQVSTRNRSKFDRPTTHDHDHDQQQQHAATPEKTDLPVTPLIQALRNDHADEQVIKQILHVRPDRTLDEYYRQLALARMRPGVRNAEALVFGLWMRGEDVYESHPTGAHDGTQLDHRRQHAQTHEYRSAARRPRNGGSERAAPYIPTEQYLPPGYTFCD